MPNFLARLLVSLLSTLFLISGAFANDYERGYSQPTASNEIKIMSYNAENLFDTEHDEGFTDFEFLPKNHPLKNECAKNDNVYFRKKCFDTDWTPARLQTKIYNMAQAIKATGALPDVLGLYEVENANVMMPLMKALNYDAFYITNGLDKRGIDNVVMFKRNKLSPIEFIERPVAGIEKATRNLSVAHFKIADSIEKNAILAVYPNHWPSQNNPVQDRISAAEGLAKLVHQNRQRYRSYNYYVVLMGDFNTLDNESPNAIYDVLGPRVGDLYDVKELSLASKNPMNGKMPPTSYYYAAKKEWNSLDRMLVSANLFDRQGLEVVPTTFRIHAPSFLTKINERGEAIPFRYNHNADNPEFAGYSDHFGLVVKLRVGRSFYE